MLRENAKSHNQVIRSVSGSPKSRGMWRRHKSNSHGSWRRGRGGAARGPSATNFPPKIPILPAIIAS